MTGTVGEWVSVVLQALRVHARELLPGGTDVVGQGGWGTGRRYPGACERFVAVLTQCPDCGYTGESEVYELGVCPRWGEDLFWRLMDPETFYALHARPGMVVWHPDGGGDGPESDRILILAIEGPDAKGMMTLTTPAGPVRLTMDWPCREYTAADADLAELMLRVCQEDL